MEPVFTSLGARAASLAAVPLVRKILVSHAPGAALTSGGTPLARRVAWGGKQAKISSADVRRLVDKLIGEILDSDPELYSLKANPEPLAEAVSDTLLSLGELDMNDIQAVNLRHDGLARKLKEAKPGARRELSESFTHLYDTVIDICCLHILDFFSSRPEFAARTQIETIGMLHAQDETLLSLLERLPDPKSVDRSFEKKYAEEIVRRYDELTIFGIDLANSRAAWPLDTAYLSLETIRAGRYYRVHAENVVSQIAEGEGSTGLPERVERALAGRQRVLMRGVAGSGKTTLIHWLAATASRQTFTDELAELNIFVPFVLPLRTLARDGANRLPTPDQFLHAVDNMQAGAQPAGWANRVLEQGRGLLLIDGVDEVDEAFRIRTRDWLRDLLKAFPQTRCVVTARPSAIPEGWLDSSEFIELALSPMRPQDVHVFVQRWHEAAKSQCDTDEAREELETFSVQLLETIDTKQDIARLTTNPLMCALVCALHRDKRGRLPRGRKALYDAALRMLLVERDDQRLIGSPEGVSLDEDDQILLLQKIAYWLIRNGLAEVEKDTAMRMVQDAISHMPAVRQGAGTSWTPKQVFDHLVTRSGMLREPTTETIEFLHRTFQDYLGARAAVENEDIPYLVQQAHNDQWEDVIRMAVAHCRPKERARLLTGLIERGDREPESRHRLYILAFVCLEHSPELDPSLEKLVEEKAGRLLPPRTLDEAERLAQVGPVLLELLPDPTGLTEEQACAAVRAISLVGGSAAIRTIAKYASDDRHTVRQEVVGAWARFDASDFAELVLARSRILPVVTTVEQARACQKIPSLRTVTCVGNGAINEMVPELPQDLIAVNILRDGYSAEFDTLSRLQALEILSVTQCPELTDLESIVDACPSLSALYLDTLPLSDFNDLSRLRRLQHLTIRNNLEPLALGEFPPLQSVLELSLKGHFEVEAIQSKFTGLRSLDISLDSPIGSLERLGEWPFIKSLRVTARDQAEGVIRGLTNFNSLQELTLGFILPAFFGGEQLKEIVTSLPQLERLTLSWAPGQLAVVDISYLANTRPDLQLNLWGAHEVRGGEQFDAARLKIYD
ncbi:ATP-binding protein [Streptomyces sp. A244]|uniref:NACHT domain-containing protein n=1 Tax=Streptomyces sp. A244 TaxID=2137016 RepID=UPI000D1B0488|nr:ATP-binding protein [Streptomyces sp. A244]